MIVMKKIIPLIVIATFFCGCNSKPVTKTQEKRWNAARAVAYNDFVNQRTEELQQMGGPFKERGAASAKAREDAATRFGGVPSDVTTTWTWGKNADRVEAQEQFTATLDDMAKSKAAK